MEWEFFEENIVQGEYTIDTPKTKSSKREIPFSEKTGEILKRWASRGKSNYLFVDKRGHTINGTTLNRDIAKIVERIQESGRDFDNFTMHSFRHTFATRCIEKGMNYKVLQKVLGHASLKMTMDLYVHVQEEMLTEEIDRIDVFD